MPEDVIDEAKRLVSAENIAISDDFFEDSSYMLYDEKSSDNTYFLQMIGKLSTNRIPFVSGPLAYDFAVVESLLGKRG